MFSYSILKVILCSLLFPSRIFSRFFYNISFQKMLSFLHLRSLWSMLHTHTRQLGIPLSLGLSVFFFFLDCPFQIEIIFVNRVVAIASVLLISGVLFPFASIIVPRYSKLLTLSISSPSIAILASYQS